MRGNQAWPIGAESTVRDEFMKRFFNSAIASVVSSSLAVILGSLAAYPLARLRMPGRNFLLGITVGAPMAAAMKTLASSDSSSRDITRTGPNLAIASRQSSEPR